MEMNFNGKTAIVTGAGQGIGYEICKQLVARGAVVYLNDIEESQAMQAASTLSGYSGSCIPIVGDSSDLEFIKAICQQAIEQTGQLNIVVANAGITLFGEFLTYSLEALNRVLQVNLAGPFLLAQQAALHMKEQPHGGRILLLSSVTGNQAHKDLAAYGMTKAGIQMLAKNLVVELSPFNITINSVAPGATSTERTKDDEQYEETWAGITPMGRSAQPVDIANAVLFLVSDCAAHITGQTLIVDGGWSSVSPSPY